MHLTHKPGEQIEVDWAGDPATYIDPDTGEILKAFVFIGVLAYSHYAYVEAFPNEKQRSWILCKSTKKCSKPVDFVGSGAFSLILIF